MRLSRIVIPIALAISLIFVGFTVYADDAQNFVIRARNEGEIRLSLTMNEDLSSQTSVLSVPFTGTQTATTFDPSNQYGEYENFFYEEGQNVHNIPNNIAQLAGQHAGTYHEEESGTSFTYTALSFWLVNNSDRAVDVDIVMSLDGLLTYANDYNHHIDDVLRVMVIEDTPLITDETYTVYAKAEDPSHPYHEDAQAQPVNYQTTDFLSDRVIFEKRGDLGLRDFAAGAIKKFTIVLWLEGNDEQCTNHIFGERAKLSIDFIGY